PPMLTLVASTPTLPRLRGRELPVRRRKKPSPASGEGSPTAVAAGGWGLNSGKSGEREVGGAASAVGVANPPWPCTAGGRHISKPRLRQGQLPNGRYRPRGISGLTHRAAPPTLYLGCLDARRNGFDALGDVADAGGGRLGRLAAGAASGAHA